MKLQLVLISLLTRPAWLVNVECRLCYEFQFPEHPHMQVLYEQEPPGSVKEGETMPGIPTECNTAPVAHCGPNENCLSFKFDSTMMNSLSPVRVAILLAQCSAINTTCVEVMAASEGITAPELQGCAKGYDVWKKSAAGRAGVGLLFLLLSCFFYLQI